MKQYKIYTHPTNETEAVKVGWSWPAFFLVFPLWAFAKRLWIIGMASVFIFGSIGFLLGMAEMASKGSFSRDARETIIDMFVFIGMLFFGYRGNAWLEEDLSLRRYKYAVTVNAANTKDALTRSPATESLSTKQPCDIATR